MEEKEATEFNTSQEYPYMDHVKMSCNLLYLAWHELHLIINVSNPREVKLVSGSPPFLYYALSLQYMLVMEFTKLLESGGKPDENVASLFKVNKYMLKTFGEKYEESNLLILKLLNSIRKSDIYKEIRDKRDEKFAHIDASDSKPFSVKALTEQQLKEISNQIDVIVQVMNTLTSFFDYTYVFNRPDDRTANFIRFQAIYVEFFQAHSQLALSEGYVEKMNRANSR